MIYVEYRIFITASKRGLKFEDVVFGILLLIAIIPEHDGLWERQRELNKKFLWTDEARESILKLNQKIFDCEKILYKEYQARKKELDKRIDAKDNFLTDYNCDMRMNLKILTLDEDGELDEPWKGIYSLLNEYIEKESEFIPRMNYDFINNKEDKEDILNWNITLGSASEYFKDDFIHYGIHCLYDHAHLAWEDILKIHSLHIEVNVDYQSLKNYL